MSNKFAARISLLAALLFLDSATACAQNQPASRLWCSGTASLSPNMSHPDDLEFGLFVDAQDQQVNGHAAKFSNDEVDWWQGNPSQECSLNFHQLSLSCDGYPGMESKRYIEMKCLTGVHVM